jgi:hypothetical protein
MSQFREATRVTVLFSIVIAMELAILLIAAVLAVPEFMAISIAVWGAGLGKIWHIDYYILLSGLLYLLNIAAFCYLDNRTRFTDRIIAPLKRPGEKAEQVRTSTGNLMPKGPVC